jgi:tetratricopeptide (TPR) repeat protein
VALVERLKRWRGLARLRRQVRRAPSPSTFGGLAERLIALGEVDEALRVAEEGLELFPDSDRLAHVRLFAKKGRLSGQIRKLREDLQRRPNPLTYSQLAQIYRELGSHDEALSIAAECAERFPLNEAPYLIQGEIRIERFRRDMIAKDGAIAEAALKKVARLNAHNVTAHLHLAEIYYLVGLLPECRKHLRQVLTIMPAAKDVQDFLRDMDATPDAGSESESFEELVEKVEKNGAFANDPDRFPNPSARSSGPRARTRIDEDRIRGEMASFGEHVGLKNAALLDKDGAVVADFADVAGLARGQFVELVTAIRDTADDASRRMDTGALARADIEGPGGNLVVVRVRGFTVAALYSDPLRSDAAAEIVQDFVARNIASSREEVRA